MPALTLDASSMTLGGDYVWLVPSLAVSVPGVLLVATAGVQATSGLIWIPMVRRRLGSARKDRLVRASGSV